MQQYRVFAKLTAFAQTLNEEEKRTVAEQLTEEELAVFDLLTKPDMTPTSTARRNIADQLASMREDEVI